MVATAKNYDIICLQMKGLIPHLEPSLKKDLRSLLADIREAITTNKKVKPVLDSMLPGIFDFRVKAIKWLAEQGEFDLSGSIDTVYTQLEDMRLNSKLETLAENTLFALRCNKKVTRAIMSAGEFAKEKITSGAAALPAITYDQFLASLAFGVPDDETAQRIVDWINASLHIEFIILAAAIINDEKLKVSERVVNELSFLVADAAQEYAAIAIELGFLKPGSENQALLSGQVGKSFVKEQKYLAGLGINDFAENF